MALRLVMPLRTIVDHILMECWMERQPIIHENHNCDYCRDSYKEERGHVVNPQMHSNHLDHYNKGLSNAKRYAAFLRHAYDENEVVQGVGYAVSGDSFDPSKSSLSCADRDKEQWKLNDYAESMPSRPTNYMSDKDTSSDSGNGFENLYWN